MKSPSPKVPQEQKPPCDPDPVRQRHALALPPKGPK